MTLTCRVCGSTDCVPVGPAARRSPTLVAGVPIDIHDLRQTFVRCNACDYAFFAPCIPEDRILECYRRSAGGHWSTDDSVATARFYSRKRDLLLKHLHGGNRVLDFGCYDGGFLASLGSELDRWGIEPSDSAAHRARRRGIQILGATVEAIDPAATELFDAIVSFDVMEHLPDPVRVLRSLRALLKPNGFLLVETGNYSFPRFRRLGPLYYYAAIVEHVGFFNERSIAEAARRAGLRVVEFQKSRHSSWRVSAVKARLIDVTYWTLRALHRMRLPLPLKWRNIALGALPRTVDAEDHFLAVLQRQPEV